MAVTASLELTGASGAEVGSSTYAQGLRAGIAAVLSGGVAASAASGAYNASVVPIDYVFIASITDASGVVVLYNSSSPVNKGGNTFNDTEQLIDSMGGVGALAPIPTSTPAPQGGVGGGSGAGRVSVARALAGGIGGRGNSQGADAPKSHALLGRRGLELNLQPDIGSLPSNGSTAVHFNILSPNTATTHSNTLKGMTPADMATIASSVSAITGNSTDALGIALVPGSVRIITLTYTYTLWSIFLDFLLRNISTVLGGALTLVLLVIMLSCWRQCTGRIAEKRAKKKRERLREKLAALTAPIKRAIARRRWRMAIAVVKCAVRLIFVQREMAAHGLTNRRWVPAGAGPTPRHRAPPPPQPSRMPVPLSPAMQLQRKPAMPLKSSGAWSFQSAEAWTIATAAAPAASSRARLQSLAARNKFRAVQPFLKMAAGRAGGGDGAAEGTVASSTSPTLPGAVSYSSASNPAAEALTLSRQPTDASLGLQVDEDRPTSPAAFSP